MSEPLEFTSLHHRDKLTVINPYGTVAICTLWSPVAKVLAWLERHSATPSPDGPIAVIGQLFGDGFPEMLRNLLYNPQIDTLIVMGMDLGNSSGLLHAFFNGAYNHIDTPNGPRLKMNTLSDAVLDTGVTSDMFEDFLVYKADGYPALSPREMFRADYDLFFGASVATCLGVDKPRIEIPLPEHKISVFPSEEHSHSITARTIPEAWAEVVHDLHRFGIPVALAKGERKALKNFKAVVLWPTISPPHELSYLGVSSEEVAAYQKALLSSETGDQPYTYGNRILGWFGGNALARVISKLRADARDRSCYISVWDTHSDLLFAISGKPCLVSLYFLALGEALDITAVFRTHNAAHAWVMNAYGIARIQYEVAYSLGLPIGSMTIVSHHISLDLNGTGAMRVEDILAARAQRLQREEGKFSEDYRGSLLFSVDRDRRVAIIKHTYNGEVLGEYEGADIDVLKTRLLNDKVIGSIEHALYVGQELQRAKASLQRM